MKKLLFSLFLLLALPLLADTPIVDCVNWSSTFAFRSILPAAFPPTIVCVVHADVPSLKASYALTIDWVDMQGQPHTSVVTSPVQGVNTIMTLGVDAQSLQGYPKAVVSISEPLQPVRLE